VLAFLLWKFPVSITQVTGTLGAANPLMLALILALLLNQYVVSSLKWRSILASHEIHLPLTKLVRIYMVGSFFGAFLPSTYMGDVVRIADVGRATGRTFESASAVVFERISGLGALAAVGSVASFGMRGRLQDPIFGALGLAFLAIAAGVVGVFIPGVVERLGWVLVQAPRMIRRPFEKVAGAVTHYRARPRLLAAVAAWSFLFQLLAYSIFYSYGRAIGLEIPYLYCLSFVPVVYLLEALPISIAGIGPREVGVVYFLERIGLGASEAIALSITVLVCRYSVILLGGILFAMSGGGAAAHAARSQPAGADAQAASPAGAPRQ
jgi:uncharacterized membrane protein YbhN (UPF0104 family)